MIAGECLRGGLAQRAAYLCLVLHACGNFFDVTRYVADFNSQFAGLRGNIADDRLRTAAAAKAETRHARLLDGAVGAVN
jgi:hypothetical protein